MKCPKTVTILYVEICTFLDEYLHHGRASITRRYHQRGPAGLGLSVDVGPVLDEELDDGLVSTLGCRIQGCCPVLIACVNIRAVRDQQLGYRAFATKSRADQWRASISLTTKVYIGTLLDELSSQVCVSGPGCLVKGPQPEEFAALQHQPKPCRPPTLPNGVVLATPHIEARIDLLLIPGGSAIEPHIGLSRVMRDPFSMQIQRTQVVLGRGKSLLGCLDPIGGGLLVVLWNGLAVRVKVANRVLSCSRTLLSRSTPPFQRFSVVLGHASPRRIVGADIILSSDVSSLSPSQPFLEVNIVGTPSEERVDAVVMCVPHFRLL